MKNIRTLFLLMSFLMIATAGAGAQEQSLQNALNPDGTLRAGADGSYNAQGYEMRLGPNGEPMFMPQTQNTVSGFWDTQIGQPGLNNIVFALAVSGNNVFVGGEFTTAGSITANRVARYDLTTNTWSSLGTGAQNGVNSGVGALAIDGSGKVYVGGNFTQAGGVSANFVARFDPATNTWSTLGTGAQNGVSSFVYALAIDGSGKVYVGGNFTQAGGVSANRVARFDPATNTWSSLGTGSSNGVNNDVYALAVVGNEVYVGGPFTSAGGVSANRVARFNTQTNTWSSLGTGSNNGISSVNPNPFVGVFAIYGNDVIVGGEFTSAGGVSANRVARYSPVTNTWSALGVSGSGVNSIVNALVVSGDILFVGGRFPLLTPSNQTANYLASYNFATDTWSVFGSSPNIGMNGNVYALAMAGGNLLAGGTFTQAETTPSNRIAYFKRGPAVNIGAVTNISSTSATLSGTINPNGLPLTLARFEYSSDPTFGAFATINTTPSATAIGSGFSPVAVSAAIPMSPNSVVFARLRATNANGTSLSPTISFNNLPIPSLPTSGLQLWLRADLLVTQTSGAVSQWNDLSGNNRHAFSTGSARPALASSAAFNNRAVIDFGTVGDKQLGFRRISDVRTAFIVGRSTAATTFQFLLGDSTTFQFHPSITGLVDAGFAAPQVRDGLVFLNGRPFAPTAAGRPSTPTIIMYETTGNAVTSTIARDRALTDNRGWRGEVAEVIIYNRVLSVAERAQVQSYLAQRYDIGVQTSATPSVPANNFGSYILGSTGVTVTFTTASTTAGSLSGSVTNSRPNVVGSLPTGIVNLAERFWTINQSGLTGFTCALTFNLSTLGGVQNFNNLKVLRRNNASSPWVDVETLSGVTITRNAPFITVAGITSFSDFTIGSDASNQLPVVEDKSVLPKQFALSQNYPNPFNPTTVISYQLPVAGNVSLKVYDVLGREVMTLVNGRQDAGAYNFTLNAASLSSGVYFYRLQSGNFVQTKKMMLVK